MKKLSFFTIAFMVAIFTACKGLTPDIGEEDDTSQDEVENEDNIDDAIASNAGNHDEASDYVWSGSSAVSIVLNGNSVTESSDKVSVEPGKIVISAAGNYSFSGTLSDGQIWVETSDDGIVRLILNGANITSSNSAPVYVKKASKVLIALADNTTNVLTDGTTYTYDDASEQEPNAAVFSKSNLTIFGEGSLQVNANFNDGISSKDGLIIASGNISVKAIDDGIRGKDYLIVKSGNISVNAGGDGLKSDNDNDDTLGYIEIISGKFAVTAKGDGISAETDLMIKYAECTVQTTASISGAGGITSAKGLKAGVNMILDDGIFSLDCTDDGIHSNGTITVNSGSYFISSGDDGMHADYDLLINDGTINITKSYEGIESYKGNITINKGTIHLASSDDGINVSAGGDMMGGPGQGGWGGTASSSGSFYLYINGGRIYVNASGDGVDSNGSIKMTDGILLVDGPTNNGNGALDFNGSFTITGGLVIAAGSSGMAQAPQSSSSQYSVLVKFSSTKSAGTLFHVQTSAGEEVLSFSPGKTYQSVAFSTPVLKKGSAYEIYTGGSSTGAQTDGLFTGGAYTGGSLYTSFTI